MKALFFEQHGEIDVLRVGELPDPKPAPGQALIKVHAAALNHLDIWVRRGWPGLKLPMPHITGSDVAGEIISVNAASHWQAGMRVIVNPGIISSEDEWTRRGQDSISPGYKILGEHMAGGLAEMVCVPVENVFRAPDGLSWEELAAPLLVGTTCWRMLFKRAALQPGESVLVVGAGGGVNSLSIQLARVIGAQVIALAGGANKCRKAKELGAEEVIDYKEVSNWSKEVLKITKGRGVDVVIDNVGASTIQESLRSVARGGRIVTVGNTTGFDVKFDNRLLFTKQVSLIGSTMGSRQDFIDAMQFIWRNKIKVVIDQVAELDKAIELVHKLEHGQQFGKLVVRN